MFHFIFLWETKGKAHCNPFKCLTVVAHFMFVSTCVTKSLRPNFWLLMCHLLRKPKYALKVERFYSQVYWLAGRAGLKKNTSSHDGPHLSADTKRGRRKDSSKKVGGSCLRHMCWSYFFLHNWKKPSVFKSLRTLHNNKCTHT